VSLEKVTVFKIIETVASFADFIRTEDGKGRALPPLEPLSLPEDLDFDGEVEAAATFKTHMGPPKSAADIPWLAFLNEGRPADGKFPFNSRNKFPCAVVALKITQGAATNFYVLTFGLGGEGFLKSDTVVKDFGLRVAMNICDKDRLRRVQTSIHEAISTQSEKQISVGSNFSVFNIDDEKEFIRAVSGAAREEFEFITSVTGRESITIKIDKDSRIDWNNIVPRVQRLGTAYDRDDYEALFPGYAKFHFETDPRKISDLDEFLFRKIRDGDLENIHLAPPEFIDFDARAFSYRDDEDAQQFDDIALEDLLASRRRGFGERSSMQSIRNMRVYVWDVETGAPIKSWSAYKCLVAEVSMAGATYILSMAQWKRVSDDLKMEVDNYVAAIPVANDLYLLNDIDIWDANARKDAQGNAIGENRESVYNRDVADASNDIFLFDTARIEIAGERNYEVCD
jgi:uncharacterized protein (TIGR04141 family)